MVALERAVVGDDTYEELRPFTHVSKDLIRAIEEAADELED